MQTDRSENPRYGEKAGKRPVSFAHPAERALAAAFDDLGIRWLYEPHTFPLATEKGRVTEACAPDFYLPELDMYIECTTMKQRLTNRKTLKYRKLRERYGVTVEIMYRRDFSRLARLPGLSEFKQWS